MSRKVYPTIRRRRAFSLLFNGNGTIFEMDASISFLLRIYRMGHGKNAPKHLLKKREKFNRVNSIDRAWQSVWRYRRASSNNKTKHKAKSIVRLAHECMCTSDRVITCTICYLFHLTLATTMFVLLLHKTRKFRIKMHDSNKISGTNWNEMKKMILWSHLVSRASRAFYISTMWSTNACNGHREKKSEWVNKWVRERGKKAQSKY